MSNTKNILFILNSLTFGGAEKKIVMLLNELDTSQLSLSLIYLRRKEALLGELNQSRLQSVSCYDGTNSLEFTLPFYLARHIKKEKIDAVVCINQRPMLYAFLSRSLVSPEFRIIQAIHVNTLAASYQRLKNLLIYRPLFNRCDLVIFDSEAQRRFWLSAGLMAPKKTECIRNGIDVDHFNDGYFREEKLELRSKLGFGETTYVVGMCARLHSGKKHTELIAALEMLRSAGIDAKLIIMGDGPERANLESIIRSKALEQDVVLTGFQEDIRPFISICDCIALTSKAESFPLSIIEGMAMGKPVVSSEVGGTPEAVEHGVTGFLYKSGDVEQLVRFLKILSDPVRRCAMGQRAKQAARDRFSLGKMVSEYNRVLASILAG